MSSLTSATPTVQLSPSPGVPLKMFKNRFSGLIQQPVSVFLLQKPLQHACVGRDTHFNLTIVGLTVIVGLINQPGWPNFTGLTLTEGTNRSNTASLSCKINPVFHNFVFIASSPTVCNSSPCLVEDAVKVAFRVSGTLLPCHIIPPWGGLEGILFLWDIFLIHWQKFSWFGN